jgi:hypothetical protein
MKFISILILASFIGCAHCGNNDEPYIRTQPGIDYCSQMCDLFEEKDCKPYYEDIETDGGVITCTEFCEYELKNSVPLNPQCIVETLKTCDEIETICVE